MIAFSKNPFFYWNNWDIKQSINTLALYRLSTQSQAFYPIEHLQKWSIDQAQCINTTIEALHNKSMYTMKPEELILTSFFFSSTYNKHTCTRASFCTSINLTIWQVHNYFQFIINVFTFIQVCLIHKLSYFSNYLAISTKYLFTLSASVFHCTGSH